MVGLVASLNSIFNPAENPIFLRHLRREAREKKPSEAAMKVGLLLCASLIGPLLIWRRNEAPEVPAAFGGSIAALCAGLVILFHLIVVIHTSQTPSARVFFLEAAQQSLEQLLLAPMTRVELLLRMAAHPFTHSFLMALVGLPLYLLLVSMGGLTWFQVLVLYWFFALLCFCVPGTSDLRLARSRNPDEEVSSSVLAEMSSSRGARAGGWLGITALFVFIVPWLTTILGVFYLPGVASVVSLPDELAPAFQSRSPGGLNWPYWLVVALSAPFHSYGKPVPLIVFVTVCLLLNRFRQFVARAADLQTPRAHAVWLEPRERRLTFIDRLGSTICMVMLVGYVWAPLVKTGNLGVMVSGQAATDYARAGLFTLLVILAGWRGMRRGYEHIDAASLDRPAAWLPPLRSFAEGIALGFTQYLLCCLLGGMSPFPASLANQAARVLPVLAGMALLLWGAVALGKAAMRPRPDEDLEPIGFTLRAPIGLFLRQLRRRGGTRLFFDAVLIFAFWVYPIGILNEALDENATASLRYAVLFPWMGPLTLALSAQSSWGPSPPSILLPDWSTVAIAQSLAGLTLIGLAGAVRRRTQAQQDREITQRSTVEAARIAKTGPVAESPSPSTRKAGSWTHALVSRLSDWASRRWDNPVLIMEILQRGRQRDWAVDLSVRSGIVGLVAMFTLYDPDVLGYGFSWTAMFFVYTEPANLILAYQQNRVAFMAALALIGAPLWILWWFGGSVIARECSQTFEKERARSTLDFLMVTPLSSESIVRAKLIGSMIPVGLMLVQYLPMFTLGIVWAFTLGMTEWITLLLVGLPYVASAILAAGCLTMAVSAMPYGRRRADRSGWGSGLFVFLEIAMLIAMPILINQSLTPFEAGAIRRYTVLTIMFLTHLAVAATAFRASLAFLQRLRTGEASFEPIVTRA